jgi:hypothetical protein
MTSKYVPSFMRDKPLVNTSLPAKEAPQLAPATLASLTSSTAGASATTVGPTVVGITSTLSHFHLEKKSIYQPLSKAVHLTDDDFPTLDSKKPVKTSALVQGTNFASLSREWAKKQEEDAIIAKDAAEKEKNRIQIEQSIRQKEAKEAEEFRNRNIMLPVKKDKIEQQVLDIGGNESDGSVADSYDSPAEVEYEEEEEEEEEMNSHWGGHHRDKW